ncbi:insulinase family protein [Agarivorans sp. TSD2052]|uniref:insulinase family protein n=1 Tax=Agarivorans sp. TSD2052 TaxID=2937286 RepID=UPI00200C0295|nr:insulinase family protein [Agarivorans sp. TSD2052]UPW20213.1 insulinase family protein [Agarivorans sp. TSD2052]
MRTSPNDPKHYHNITLDNGLKVLLIQDQDAQKSAASLAVNIGHFHDPEGREGLAHFLEHMLFLGTESYPVAGEYQSFINRHGGSNNAWTGTEHTNFYFDIENDWFDEALDRFSQFFICPCFNPELVDRERQAVDSEYKLKLKDDVRRLYQVHKETMNPAHPFSQFSVGNLDTLSDTQDATIRDDLIDFYQQHYSAHLMTLVLISPQAIDSLEEYVVQLFNAVPRVAVKTYDFAPLYLAEHLGLEIHIQPVKELKKLTLSFGFGNMDPLYRIKPLTYIAHLLGYEGPGSLVALLRHAGLINSMAAGGGISGSNFKDFCISYNLTEEGLTCIDSIIDASFSYLKLIQNQGLQAWRYSEKQQVFERAFLYQEKSRAIDLVSHLSVNLQHYPAEDVIYGDYAMEQYDQALIEQCLKQLSPDNLRITIVSAQQPCNKIAKWYHTPYSVEPIAKQRLDRWRQPAKLDSLQLPSSNPFLSFNTTPLVEVDDQEAQPRLLYDKPGFRLWFSNEPEFKVPKGHLYVSVDSAYSVASVRNIVCSRLMVELMLDHLSEMTYQAEIAGMSYQLYSHQGGYTLHLSGFSDKQILLLKMIMNNRLFGHFERKRFGIIKQQLSKHWQNQMQVKPISQLFSELTSLLQPNNPPPAELLKALEDIQLEDMPDFVAKLYQNIHIEMLAYGNWAESEIHQLGDFIQQEISPDSSPSKETPRKLVSIKDQATLLYEVDCKQSDSALMVYFQSRDLSPESIALFALSNHIMTSTFFNELRTKQQLGYIVGTGNLPLNRHPGIIFYVQSPHGQPQTLLDAINDFLDAFPVLMFELSDAQWQQSKQGLIAQILERESNMRTRAQRFWVSIGNKDHKFNQRQLAAKRIEQLERRDLVRFMMSLKSKQRDRIVVYNYGGTDLQQGPLNTHHLETGHYISDRTDFQRQAKLYSYN